MFATLIWMSNDVRIAKRAFLFSIDGKTMSGKILELIDTDFDNVYFIHVDFIAPSYFEKNLGVGKSFTINEVSKILGTGQIISSHAVFERV
jgi:hypothetical protein